jgi:hypothetical protein
LLPEQQNNESAAPRTDPSPEYQLAALLRAVPPDERERVLSIFKLLGASVRQRTMVVLPILSASVMLHKMHALTMQGLGRFMGYKGFVMAGWHTPLGMG